MSFSTFKRIFFKPYPNKPKDNTNPKTGSNSENFSMVEALIILFFLYLKLINLKSKVL